MPENSEDMLHQHDGRINVNKSDDMDYWSNELKAPPQIILAAVRSVGPRVEDVREWLRNNGMGK
jgi:hypothetical protein